MNRVVGFQATQSNSQLFLGNLHFSDGTSVTESIAFCPPPLPTPPRGGGIITPHIKSIPESVDIRHSLLVIKVHKVVLIVVYYVVLFLARVACRRRINAVRDWKKTGGGLGREYTTGPGQWAEGDFNIKQ